MINMNSVSIQNWSGLSERMILDWHISNMKPMNLNLKIADAVHVNDVGANAMVSQFWQITDSNNGRYGLSIAYSHKRYEILWRVTGIFALHAWILTWSCFPLQYYICTFSYKIKVRMSGILSFCRIWNCDRYIFFQKLKYRRHSTYES